MFNIIVNNLSRKNTPQKWYLWFLILDVFRRAYTYIKVTILNQNYISDLSTLIIKGAIVDAHLCCCVSNLHKYK